MVTRTKCIVCNDRGGDVQRFAQSSRTPTKAADRPKARQRASQRDGGNSRDMQNTLNGNECCFSRCVLLFCTCCDWRRCVCHSGDAIIKQRCTTHTTIPSSSSVCCCTLWLPLPPARYVEMFARNSLVPRERQTNGDGGGGV